MSWCSMNSRATQTTDTAASKVSARHRPKTVWCPNPSIIFRYCNSPGQSLTDSTVWSEGVRSPGLFSSILPCICQRPGFTTRPLFAATAQVLLVLLDYYGSTGGQSTATCSSVAKTTSTCRLVTTAMLRIAPDKSQASTTTSGVTNRVASQSIVSPGSSAAARLFTPKQSITASGCKSVTITSVCGAGPCRCSDPAY
jgi:hypothetical protein